MRSAVPKTAARPVIIPDAYIALPLVKPPVRYETVRFRCGLQLRARRVIKSWCPSFINATRRAGLCQYRAAPLVWFNVKHHQSSAHPWCKKEKEKERKKEIGVGLQNASREFTLRILYLIRIFYRGMRIDRALMLHADRDYWRNAIAVANDLIFCIFCLVKFNDRNYEQENLFSLNIPSNVNIS